MRSAADIEEVGATRRDIGGRVAAASESVTL
jgi:hypothetical protein